MLLYFDDERRFAARLARAGRTRSARIRRHRFPDDELRLTLPPRLPKRVAILRSLDHPNEKLVELLLAAQTARSLGAVHVTLVAPYLAYMRQDRAFALGEAVSQRHVGTLLSALFDRVMTVDPHLHRVSRLDDALPATEAVALSAAPLVGAFLSRKAPGALLMGPDEESEQWVTAAAAAARAEWATCRKRRTGERRVRISLPDVTVRGRHVVLVDDLASTGRTLAGAARALVRAGAARVDVAVTHAIFAGDALATLTEAGVGQIWSTDSVRHPTNVVSLAPLVARGLAR